MKKLILILAGALLFTSCQSKSDDPTPAPKQAAEANADHPAPTVSFDDEDKKAAEKYFRETGNLPPKAIISASVNSVTNNFSQFDADLAFSYAKSSTKLCYSNHLANDNTFKGDYLLNLTIDANGKIVSQKYTPEIESNKFAACLTEAANHMRFPKTKDGNNAEIEYKLHFEYKEGKSFDEAIKEMKNKPMPANHDHDHDHE